MLIEATSELQLAIAVVAPAVRPGNLEACGGRLVVTWWFAPQPFAGWRSLTAAGLVDQSSKPTEVRLQPFALNPKTYDFRATAHYEAS